MTGASEMTGASGRTAAVGDELLAIAVSAAREAGALLASREGRVLVAATKSSPTDVVTEMDRRAEDLIRERILAARPSDAILGEEGGQIGDAAAGGGVRWVIDPLDGTVNYLYGLHDWAVSIAAEVDGEILAGAVFAAMRGELFTAVRGGGAWLEAVSPAAVSPAAASGGPAGRSVPLRCRPDVPLAAALIGTGFGYLAARRQIQGEVVAALLPRVRDIRRGGSASVDLCSVAAGRLDGYYERGLNYWDYAAGALIATEAGAAVGDSRGGPPSTSMTVAAGPGLFGPLTLALSGLDAERDG
jgi:myo-inositol-1(or 4)-monophosphatase